MGKHIISACMSTLKGLGYSIDITNNISSNNNSSC